MKRTFATLALILSATGSFAATLDELIALREAALPGQCSGAAALQEHEVERGTLYQLRCRYTAMGQMDVFVQETSSGLELLRFPELQYRPAPSPSGLPDWANASIIGIMTIDQLLSAHVSASANIIKMSLRLAPGAGSGHIDTLYRLEEFGPVLESTVHVSEGGDYSPIWPEPKTQAAVARIEPNPEELNPQAVEGIHPGTLFDILGQVGLSFPENEEEGRPKLQIDAMQNGDTLTVGIEEKGWADDSVEGRLFRLVLNRAGEMWAVTEMGTAWICARGDAPISTTTCP